MTSIADDPKRLLHWFSHEALPLWSSVGFDRQHKCFQEGLRRDGAAAVDKPRRTMVQARQIFVYAQAVQHGWFAGAHAITLDAAHSMVLQRHKADGQPGWVMALDAAGKIVDPTRDLYAQAFALLAMAAAHAVSGDDWFLEIADETLDFLDRHMAAPAGGYVSALPSPDGRLLQNPHMHLFEALLALHETAPHGGYGARAQAILTLFETRFLAGRPFLVEEFDAGWQPLAGANASRFEPGHHFEWLYLFHRAATLLGTTLPASADALMKWGVRGLEPSGLVAPTIDTVAARPAEFYRLWPVTEALRTSLLADPKPNGALVPGPLLAALGDRLLAPAPAGCWLDTIDPRGGLLHEYIPASSLYHITGALCQYQAAGLVGPSTAT